MTKKGKNKKLIALASVLAVSCSCGVAQAVATSDVFNAPVAVYAENTVSPNVQAFADAVADLKAAANGLSNDEARINAKVAELAWAADVQYGYVKMEGSEADPADKEVYDEYEAIFADLFLAAKNVDSAVNNINNEDLIVYASEKATYDAYFAYLTGSLSAEEIAIINNVGTGKRDTEKKDAIDTYFQNKLDAEQAAKNAVNAVDKDANGDIVLDSLTSINEAKAKVEAVYGPVADLDQTKAADMVALWNTLKGYEDDYNALVEAYGEVVTLIEGVWATYNDGAKCVTIESAIVDAEGAYALLSDAADNDQKAAVDAATAVNSTTKLAAMRAELNARLQAISEVEDDIADIEDPVIYDNAKILVARGSFDALPEEITSLDATAVLAYVDNYDDLVKAEDDYATLVAAVKAIKNDIASLAGKYADGSLTAKFMTDIKLAKNDLKYAEQKAEIENDDIRPGTTYQEELEAYQTKYEAAVVAAGKVIVAIKAIPTPVTLDSADEIIAAEKAYAELKDEYKPFVSNYADLEAAREALNTITADVNAWKALVDALPAKDAVTINDKAAIEACVGAFDNYNFSAEMVSYITNNLNDTWVKYNDVKDALGVILGKIGDVADAYLVDAIVNVGDDPDLAAVGAFATAYEAADLLYKDLTADELTYFAANYTDADAARLVAEVKYEVYGVEAKIAALPEVNALVLANYDAVAAVNTTFTALSQEKQAQVRNADKLADCVARMAEITGALDAWKEEVNAYVAGDLAKVDLDVIDDYKDDYAAYDVDEQNYVQDAYDNLLAKAQIIEDDIAALNDRIADMKVKLDNVNYSLTANDRAELNSIKAAYDALHQSQKDKVNYADISEGYNRINVVDYMEASIANLLADAKAGNLTADGYVTYNVINAVYFNLSDEIKALITNADKLAEIKAIYEADDAVKFDIKALDAAIKAAEQAIAANKDLIDANKDLIDANKVLIDAMDAAYKAADQAIYDKIAEEVGKINDAVAAADGKLGEDIAKVAKDLADALIRLDAKDGELNDAIEALDKAYKAADKALDDAIKALDKKYGDLVKELKDMDTTLDGKIAKEVNDRIEAINGLRTELTEAFTTADGILSGKIEALADRMTKAEADIDALEAEVDALIAALDKEVADREAADKKLEDKLMAEIKALNTKLVVASVVLAVFVAGLIACVVLLFLKKQDK